MRRRNRPPKTGARAVAATPAPRTGGVYAASVWLLGAFLLAMVVAFWPTYFSRLADQPTYHPHLHGLAMTAWCVLVVAQAVLIRSGRRALHARLGLTSYALVPLMVAATLHFIHFRVRGVADLGPFGLYFLSLIVNALVAFVALWGLGLYHRARPAVHARYMLATVFPLFTPVTDRLFGPYVPSVVSLVPRIDGAPVLPAAGFLLADGLLVGLCLWDWRVNRRTDVFPVALAIVVAYHVSVLTFYRLPAWAAFGAWFVTLPLS
jgi:hypothetical protein